MSNQKVYYHKIGTDPSFDSIALEDKDYPYNTFTVKVTDDERYVIIREYYPEEDKSVTYFKEAKGAKDFNVLFAERHALTTIIGSSGDTLLAISQDKDAYNGQVVEIDTKNPRKWISVIKNQEKYRIKDAFYADNKYCIIFQMGFQESICLFSRDGDLLKTISLPEGSANKLICYSPDQSSIILSKKYYTNPSIGQLISLKDYSATPIDKTFMDFNPFNYAFYLTHYPSKDGTEIPIYIVAAKDFDKHKAGPALLNVFGGFGTSPEAAYNPEIFSFLNNGGVYAVANVRGGANSVKDWHSLGAALHKQNAIDDTYYAAKFLSDSGFAQPDKIAIAAGSHGAMVAAATINQHPAIFKAAILINGIYDMLRYENFTAGVLWTEEYGSVSDSLQFRNLYSYSPLHHIRSNTNYPSILISTSEYNDREPPLHSYKYAATLQKLTKSKNPILLHVNKGEGRAIGILDKDAFSFLFKELNMNYNPTSFYKDK